LENLPGSIILRLRGTRDLGWHAGRIGIAPRQVIRPKGGTELRFEGAR
jgi:hypothetical protein